MWLESKCSGQSHEPRALSGQVTAQAQPSNRGITTNKVPSPPRKMQKTPSSRCICIYLYSSISTAQATTSIPYALQCKCEVVNFVHVWVSTVMGSFTVCLLLVPRLL